jgi:general secretion pathway protein N
LAGLVLGALLALLLRAPAAWLGRWVAQVSNGHVLLLEARGTLWDGSADLVLTGGPGSRDASRLPSRLHWQLGLAPWTERSLQLRLRADCCIPGELPLRLQPGWGRLMVALPTRPEPLLRLPAAWLSGLGTPWNTLQLGGQLRVSAQDFQLLRQGSAWKPSGLLNLDLNHLSSRVSTVSPLGSYRFALMSQGDAPTQLILSTTEGALLLQGQGQMGGGSPMRFQGEAMAAPGREAALNNLLNIIGRRQGERSLITFGRP